MFSLKNVKFKDIINLKELKIEKHSITCIVGESGSGKTTLLKLLNKMITCDSGEIFFDDKSINDIDPIELRRKVVMLAQSPVVFNGTVRDNLLIGLKFSEKPLVGNEELANVLKLVKLKKELDDDAQNLSGGEKQRIALGRIILMEPEVLLLDEPSSALDEDTENIIIQELVNYTKENNKTLIMVTHSKRIAKDFADYIIEIEKNEEVIQEGV